MTANLRLFLRVSSYMRKALDKVTSKTLLAQVSMVSLITYERYEFCPPLPAVCELQRNLRKTCQKPANRGQERQEIECSPECHLAHPVQLVETIKAKSLWLHPEQIIKSSM